MTAEPDGNPLADFFERHRDGPGIWKWRHYFEIYHRHFQRFVGKPLNMLEIGVYSGGSLAMWRDYFGPGLNLFGVDIQPECKAYETDGVTIFIGDQGDSGFWRSFKSQTPKLDIVVDDGGHRPEQQLTTFLELLPHMAPGGVYLCEDIHGSHNMFGLYMLQLAHNLNACQDFENNPENPERRSVSRATEFQSSIHSIHFYPYVCVVECNAQPVEELVAPKRGSTWQPFLK